jgi:hypothetical protein
VSSDVVTLSVDINLSSQDMATNTIYGESLREETGTGWLSESYPRTGSVS